MTNVIRYPTPKLSVDLFKERGEPPLPKKKDLIAPAQPVAVTTKQDNTVPPTTSTTSTVPAPATDPSQLSSEITTGLLNSQFAHLPDMLILRIFTKLAPRGTCCVQVYLTLQM